MTVDASTRSALTSLLSRWPGRFRSPEVVHLLQAEQDAGLPALANDILLSLAADRDAAGAVAELLRAGRFDTAERVINQCPDLDVAGTTALRKDLAEARAHALQEADGKVVEQTVRARSAGVVCELDRQQVARLATADRRTALDRIEAEKRRIDTLVEAEAGRLLASLGTDPDPLLRHQCEVLLADGDLRAAQRLLSGQRSGRSWPAVVPRMPSWPWSESAYEVLSWYEARGALPRPEFEDWKATTPEGLQVVETLWALRDETAGAAEAFFQALNGFLHAGPPAAVPHRPASDRPLSDRRVVEPVFCVASGTGWLARLPSALAVGSDVPAVVRPRVDVYVQGPDGAAAPESARPADPLLLIATGTTTRRGPRGRTPDAVVTLEDLLLLVRQNSDRVLHLLRIACPQWPLSAVSAGSADELRRLFDEAGTDEADRVTALAWTLDLAGHRGWALADAITHETALIPDLVEVFLQHLERPSVDQASPTRRVQRWADDPATVAAVQDAVLVPFARPCARLAFWALLAEGTPPGSPVESDSILDRVELSAPEAVEVVREQLPVIGRSPLVEVVGGTAWRLRPCGVTTYLVGTADNRLDEILPAALTSAHEAKQASVDRLAWHLLRYALLPGYGAATALVADGAAATAKVLDALRAEAARTATATLDMAGDCDLEAVLGEVAACYRASHPQAEIVVATAGPCSLPFHQGALQSILFEIVERASHSFRDGIGKILVEYRKDAELVEVDIRDDGPGIAVSPGRAHQVLVRPGAGDELEGLRRARALAQLCHGGDVRVVAPSDDHLLYGGALIQLSLPRLSPVRWVTSHRVV